MMYFVISLACMGYRKNKRKLVNGEVSLQFLNVSLTLPAYQELSQATIIIMNSLDRIGCF